MNYETLTNTSVISRSEDEIANTHTQQHQQPRQMPLFNQDQEFQTQQLDQPSRGEVPNSDLVSGSANSSPSKAQQHSRNYHLKHVQQQIHTNGSPEKKPSRKTKHPVSTKKAVDQFVDVDENDKPQEDEIVIPEHLISQVHTNVKSDPDKRLSTVTTSSYTKKVKKNYVGPWKLGRTLGRGATGRVRLAKHSKTGQLAAVKIVPKSTFKDNGNNDNMTNGIEREIIIMKLISHPNIMALYDVWENKGELYLILEYVECGELFNYLVKKIRLDEREAVHYFKQIISGINYCHSFNICHRDLKPENLLLDKYHNIKIADFGMAALEVTNKMLNTSCGSPHYASPEVVMGESYHGGPSDIWSCGIILFALLTGHLPFDDDHMTRLLAKVRSGIFRIPSYVSSEARDLIKKMLTVNPEKRITIEEILAHPLLQKYPDTGFYYPRNKKNKNYMESPLPKDIMKQPIPPETVDKEILKNLQTLWHGERKSKILEKLMTNDENAEKLFYYLLLKYRQEHAAPPPSKTKSKKKPIMQTSGDTTARDLIKDKKLAMTKSTSIVSTTIIDESGNKVTHISKEPLSNHAKVRSTSYKKLTNSKYSLNKIESSTSRSNLASGQSSNNINKRKTRDIDGHMVISASLSYRKGISFNTHSRTKSTNSFKSFKNTSPYNSFYNFKNYQGLDAAVASNDIPQKIETAVVSAPENNITPAIPSKRDSGSHSLMTKSMSKRDSFNAFSLSSIENYAAYIDHPFELPASTSGKSLTSPKKKQRKSLTDSHSVLADITMSNSVKRLSGVSSRSKRSILNNSTSKKSIRYKTKARKDLLKKPALNLPELPRLPNELPALKTNAAAFSPHHDLTSGLSTNEFAFFCEQVFGFEKETPNHSTSNKSSLLEHLSDYDELKKLYQQKIMIQKQEELKKEQERLAAINEAKALAEKVKEIFEKARLLEIENQQLLKEREAKERSASLPTDANSDSNFEDSKALDPSKLKQRRAVSEAANPEPSQRQSPKKATKVGKAPKQKKSLLGINSTLLNSPTGALIENSSTINGSPTRQSKKDLKTLPSLLTGGTNEEDKFQDAMESLGRQTTASTFSFDFNSPKNQSLISSNSILGDKKPSFNFGHSSTKTPAVPIPEETSSGRKSSVSSEVPSSKFELSFPTPITPSKFDFKSDKKVSLFSNFSNNSSNKFSFHFSPSENKPSSDKLVTTTVVAKSDKLKRNSSIKASPVNNKFSLVPQRDAPKPPQSKAALAVLAASPSSTPSSKLQSTQTNVKTIVTKGNSLIVKANATTKTTSLPEPKKLDGTTSAPLTPLAITSASTPTTATTSTNVTGTTDGTSHESVNRALQDNVSTTSSTSKTLTGAQKTTSSSSTAKAKLITLDKSQDTAATASPASAGAGAATGGSPVVPSAVGTESSDDKEGELAGSKYSKAPSITTTTASSIITNPKTKQSWFSKVINNFVPSASHEDEFRYESFLLVEDVQTLIRNSLTLRLKEGSVSKVKFDTNGISTVVPAKLANGRSLKVKISINPLKSSRNDNKLLNYKKKSVVSVIKEKGLAKAFSKMGQTIQLTIQNEENQFKTRETRLLKRYD